MKNLTQIKTNSKKGYCDLRTGEWNETIRDCISSFKREYERDKFVQIYVPEVIFDMYIKLWKLWDKRSLLSGDQFRRIFKPLRSRRLPKIIRSRLYWFLYDCFVNME